MPVLQGGDWVEASTDRMASFLKVTWHLQGSWARKGKSSEPIPNFQLQAVSFREGRNITHLYNDNTEQVCENDKVPDLATK